MKISSVLLSILFVITFISGCGGVSSNSAPVYEDRGVLISHLNDSTVALVLRTDDGVSPYCTGVWVSPTKFLTAYHCVDVAVEDNMEKALKKFADGEDLEETKSIGVNVYYIIQNEVTEVGKEPSATHLAKSVSVDPRHDIALVEAQGNAIPQHQIAKLADQSPVVGEHVMVCGHVIGLYWTLTEGLVSAYRETMPYPNAPEGPFLQLSAPVYHGNSGGGAFNSDGELVGIVDFMVRAPNTNFFIHLKTLKSFTANKI